LKLAEGLLYEPVMIALRCGTIRYGEGAARHDLRVLVADQISYGRDVPVGHPAVTPLLKVCHYFAGSARIFIGCGKILGAPLSVESFGA
jgi:hypothetical protein